MPVSLRLPCRFYGAEPEDNLRDTGIDVEKLSNQQRYEGSSDRFYDYMFYSKHIAYYVKPIVVHTSVNIAWKDADKCRRMKDIDHRTGFQDTLQLWSLSTTTMGHRSYPMSIQ